MGCINQKVHLRAGLKSTADFYTDTEIQPGVFKPLETTLFNHLRKTNEIEIIRSPASNKIFVKQDSPNFSVLTSKDIKMLYSFKNLLFVGQCQQMIDRVRNECQPKSMYVISEQQARKFLQHFPLFKAGEPIQQPKSIPIYALNSRQIVKKGPQKHIFLHSSINQSKKVYQKMKLVQVVRDSPQTSAELMAQELPQYEYKNILFCHEKQRTQDDLLQMLSHYLVSAYGVDLLAAQVYLRRCLPQTSINTQKLVAGLQFDRTNKTIPETTKKQQLSTTQRLQQLFHNLQKQIKSQNSSKNPQQHKTKINRGFNLLVTLLSNIYNNKTNESFRTVRKSNNQIYELLGRYKNGVKLLKELGFVDKGASFVNVLEEKYLKILRVDLEMGYKNYLEFGKITN